MINFDDNIVMKEQFLKELNIAIDKVIEEKQQMGIDYDILEHILGNMLRVVHIRNTSQVEKIIPMKKEEMLKITLDFFKSVDEEFYKKAVNLILQQHKNIKMKIYNAHKIQDYSKKDEIELYEYTRLGSVQTDLGESRVNIPTQTQLNLNERILDDDAVTLKDLYIAVHEISHMFDLNIEASIPDKEAILGKKTSWNKSFTRELLGESTAHAFEIMLTDYLLKNNLYSKDAILQVENQRANSALIDAKLVYTKLVLAKEKEKSGNITLEHVEKLMRENNMSIQGVRRLARQIIDDPRDMLFEKRYAIAGLVAPTIAKIYSEDNEKGIEIIKDYLKEAKEDNLQNVLKILGIEVSEKGINKLIQNMKNQEEKVNQVEGR